MKRYGTRLILGIGIVALVVASNRCKSPVESDDDLPPAPAPPVMIEPHADTTIWYAISPQVQFNWTALEGAQAYEIDIDSSAQFNSTEDNPNKILARTSAPPTTVMFPRVSNQRFYYRIRATSQSWRTGMTEWSLPRWLVLRYQPGY